MAKLALVYGLRLLPGEELDSVGEGSIVLKNGRKYPFLDTPTIR